MAVKLKQLPLGLRHKGFDYPLGRKEAALKIVRQRAADRNYSVSDWAAREVESKSGFEDISRREKAGWIGYGWNKSRGIARYALRLGMTKERLKSIIMEKMREKGRLDVLDLGCGYADFLAGVSRFFEDKSERKRLNLEGLTLARPLRAWQAGELPGKFEERRKAHPHEKAGGKLETEEMARISEMKKISRDFGAMTKEEKIKVRVGLAETYQFGKKYDLIFSVMTMHHTLNPQQALKNTLSHLKQGGQAYVDFVGYDIAESKEIGAWLAVQGIKKEPLGRPADRAYLFTKE